MSRMRSSCVLSKDGLRSLSAVRLVGLGGRDAASLGFARGLGLRLRVGRYEGDQGVPDGLSFRQLKAEIVLHCVLGRRVP